MAIGAIFDIRCGQVEYEEVMRRLTAAGAGEPAGRLYHIAGPAGGRWRVVDVWESPAALERFAGTLLPIMEQVGIPPVQPDVYPLHTTIVGQATTPA